MIFVAAVALLYVVVILPYQNIPPKHVLVYHGILGISWYPYCSCFLSPMATIHQRTLQKMASGSQTWVNTSTKEAILVFFGM